MENKKRVNIHQIFWYFILFSILGLIIETIYAYITIGVLESRKGLIWGPFCPVYGVGGICLISLLSKIDKKSYLKLFVFGFLIGSAVEYLLSFGLEAIYGARFWDYSYLGSDINGRICVLYSLFWGVLSILLMKLIKPRMDKLIDRIWLKAKASVEIIIAVFLIVDTVVTVWAVNTYETRALESYYGEQAIATESYNIIDKIENEYFTNERMKRTFPNLRTKDREGNPIFIRDIINN